MKLNNFLRNFLLVLGMSLLLTACAEDINSDNNPTSKVDVTQNLVGPYVGDDIAAATRFRELYANHENDNLTAYLNSQDYSYMDELKANINYENGVEGHSMLSDYFGKGTPYYNNVHNNFFDWTLPYDEHEENYCSAYLGDEWVELEELYEHEELIEACRERIAELVATNGWSSGDNVTVISGGIATSVTYYPWNGEYNAQILPVNEITATKSSVRFPHSYHQDLARYTSLINDCTSNCHIRYTGYIGVNADDPDEPNLYKVTTGRGTYSVSPISADSQWITTYTKIPFKEKAKVGDSTYNNPAHNFCWTCHANLPSPYRAPHGYIVLDNGTEVQANGNCSTCHALGLNVTTASGDESFRGTSTTGGDLTSRANYYVYYWDNTTQGDASTGYAAETTGALREDIFGTKPLVPVP